METREELRHRLAINGGFCGYDVEIHGGSILNRAMSPDRLTARRVEGPAIRLSNI